MCRQDVVRTSSIIFMVIMMVTLHQACIAGGMSAPEELTGVVWKWQQTRYNNDSQAVPADPTAYTMEFMPDGTMHVRADCNRVGGNYTIEGSRISIELTRSTRAMCPPDSLDQSFKKDLQAAAGFFFKDGFLYLDLKYDSGTMKLGR